MKTVKHILTSVFLVLGLVSFAQVGVGTQNPSTTLDVAGANHTTVPGALAAADGVTVPRVTTDMTGSPVAGTTAGQLVYSTANTGFYFWDGDSWELVGGSATPTFRNDTTGSVTSADINNYIIVGANVTYAVAGITGAAGDSLHFIGTGTGFSIMGLPAGQSPNQPVNGGGITLISNGTNWYTLSGF